MKRSDAKNIKIGDILKLRHDLTEDVFYDGIRCNDFMGKEAGKCVIVRDIGYNLSKPYILVTHNVYRYAMDMFTPYFKYGK